MSARSRSGDAPARSPSRRPSRVPVLPDVADTRPHCAENDCQRQQAEALTRIADTLDQLKPAAEVVHDLADRLEKLCKWSRRWGPWLLASAPLVASIVGAISPELKPLVEAVATAIAAQAAGG